MLAKISHNIAEHTETLLRILSEENLDPELVSRMKEHILLEEGENQQMLSEVHSSQPTPMAKKLLDHSFFLQKMLKDEEMPVDLKKELLHHFAEEHQEWGVLDHTDDSEKKEEPMHHSSSTPTSSSEQQAESNNDRSWTVGPMWQQGE